MSEQLRFLTRRQRVVYNLRAKGMTDQQVADQLGIARRTVEAHIQAITLRAKAHGYTWRKTLVREVKA